MLHSHVFGQRLKNAIALLIGVIGVVTAFFSSFDIFNRLVSNTEIIGIIAIAYILLLSVVILSAFIVRHFQTSRKEKYANIAKEVHHVHHLIRNFHTFYVRNQPAPGDSRTAHDTFIANCRKQLIEILDHIAIIFRSLTSTSCRAAIKAFYEFNNEFYLHTLCRDSRSMEACMELDNWRVSRNHDPLRNNTKFERIFDPNNHQWHFMSNNIPNEKNFSFTSRTAYQRDYGVTVVSRGLFDRLFKDDWKVPYRSAITCAIRQGAFQLCPNFQQKVNGFLTIDSESRNVFVEQWDVDLMFSFADPLFHVLERVFNAQDAAIKAGVDLTPQALSSPRTTIDKELERKSAVSIDAAKDAKTKRGRK